MKKTFLDYLMEIHAKDYHGTDDDMADAFEAWLIKVSESGDKLRGRRHNREAGDIIEYAQKAVNELLESYERLAKLAEKLEAVNEQAIVELKKIGAMAI